MTDWPHAPVHRLHGAGAYMVTAGTYNKEKLFHSPERLDLLRDFLFKLADEFEWKLQAWAVLSNHYHFIALTEGEAENLRKLISKLHTLSARDINRMDSKPGRKVWFQFWDSRITFERSYLARLNYVHQNPVHHGLVKSADQYPWCSARWFMANASKAFAKTVFNFKMDRVNVGDDF